ncbi:MAG: cell-cell cohesion protein MtsF [Myxococcales bacterium]|nr:cell-cell cohesion protein MtsF [Myxococcales bacterium]
MSQRVCTPHPLVGSLLILTGLFAVATSCEPPPPQEEEELAPEWVPPPDVCNTKEEALADPACELAVGKARLELIGLSKDQDWFTVKLPANLTPRSLLHVSAGYSAPNTAVELAVNVLRKDGTTSLTRGVDAHGQAAPRPIDLIVPFGESGAQLLIHVADGSPRNAFDARNPYSLKVEVVENPDVNEPNDEKPTAIPLSPQGAALAGTQAGYLATAGDVDRFSFQAPNARKILYLRVSGPKLTPPPPFRVEFVVLDPQGTQVSEGRVLNEFLPLELASARLVTGGAYTLLVRGYAGIGTAGPVPGDLRLQYSVEVKLLDELDSNEPNDSFDDPKVVSLGAPGGSAQVFTGRLERTPDAEWFAFDLAATSRPTVFYYKVTPSSTGGRFPALPGAVDRQLRVFTVVNQGATLADRIQACKTNDNVCPRKEAGDFTNGLIDDYCSLTPPRCMRSSREEDSDFANIRNFEGALPVAPHSSTVRTYVLFEDESNDYADDKEFQLRVEWRTDPDEESRPGTVSRAIAEDAAASGFPVPPSGPAFELTGRLSFGHGYWRNFDYDRGQGVRSGWDYDAIVSDRDRYELVFPAGIPDPTDRTWELQWEIDHAGGGAPYDVVLELEFCDGNNSTSSCSVVARKIGYKGGDLGAWHSAGVAGAPFQPVYSRSSDATRTTVTALAWGCFCFERRFVKGGRFYINVVAVDRSSYADMPYRIRTAFTSYPKPYNGGICPAPAQSSDGSWSGGCQFTR